MNVTPERFKELLEAHDELLGLVIHKFHVLYSSNPSWQESCGGYLTPYSSHSFSLRRVVVRCEGPMRGYTWTKSFVFPVEYLNKSDAELRELAPHLD